MTEAKQMTLTMESMDAYMSLFGLNDQNVALIEQECSVHVALRGNELVVTGEAAGSLTLYHWFRPWIRTGVPSSMLLNMVIMGPVGVLMQPWEPPLT